MSEIAETPSTAIEKLETNIEPSEQQEIKTEVTTQEEKTDESNDVADAAASADPTTGLTEKEVEAVQTHWSAVFSTWKKVHGKDFFMTLFSEYPNIKGFFKTFEGMSDEEIKGSGKLRAHVINFGNGLNSFIDNLEDPDTLLVLIQKLTNSHHRRKITVNEFKDAFACFMKYAAEHSEVDEFTAGAWTKAIATVTSVIDTQLKALEAGTAEK